MIFETQPFNRIFCVGRNYINHAKELNNQVPQTPVIFIKPVTCLVRPQRKSIPHIVQTEQIHYEAELVLVIGQKNNSTKTDKIDNLIAGYTLGLDLTLRDLQTQLKNNDLPWEKSKAFDYSAPIGDIVPLENVHEIENLEFECYVNNEKKQHGKVRDMIFSFIEIIEEISRFWKLIPGDLIYTGTPEGSGALHPGDSIRVSSEQTGAFEWKLEEK